MHIKHVCPAQLSLANTHPVAITAWCDGFGHQQVRKREEGTSGGGDMREPWEEDRPVMVETRPPGDRSMVPPMLPVRLPPDGGV